MIPGEGFIGPHGARVPRKTLFRVCGPFVENGMTFWRIFNVWTRQQMGGDCFSVEEACDRARDLEVGKVGFFFQGIPFGRSTDG